MHSCLENYLHNTDVKQMLMLQEWADYLFPGSTSQPVVSSAPLTSMGAQVDPLTPVI